MLGRTAEFYAVRRILINNLKIPDELVNPWAWEIVRELAVHQCILVHWPSPQASENTNG